MQSVEVERIVRTYALGNMAADARRPIPVTAEEASAMFHDRLDDSDLLRKKGPYVKHMRFFRYLEAGKFYDKDGTSRAVLTH